MRPRTYYSRRKRKRIAAKSHGRCALCAGTEELIIDHIIPLSKGGSDGDDNLRLLCGPCDAAKADALPAPAELPRRLHRALHRARVEETRS